MAASETAAPRTGQLNLSSSALAAASGAETERELILPSSWALVVCLRLSQSHTALGMCASLSP